MNSLTISTKNTMLYACIAMLCLLILARDIMGMGIPGMAFAFIVAVSALILKLDKFKLFLFFLFPFTCGVPGNTMLVSIIALLVKSIGKSHIRSLQIVPTVIIALLELFDNMIHVGDIDISAYASFISFTAVFFFILFDKSNHKQSRECVIAFIFGTIFVCVVIYYKMITEFGMTMILAGNLRGNMGDIEMEKVGKLILNANSMAYLSIIVISCVLMGIKKLKISSILCYFLLTLSILFGMGSFSRTWMILFFVVLIIYLMYNRNFKSLLSIFIFGGIMIIAFPSILEGFSNVMTDRMNDDNFATAGGRTNAFEAFNKAWSQNLLYIIGGTGVTSYHEVLGFKNYSIHNALQQIYVCLGISGLILYFTMFLRFFKTKICGVPNIYNYLPFGVGVIFLQTIQFLHPYYLILPMIPACYAFLVRDSD